MCNVYCVMVYIEMEGISDRVAQDHGSLNSFQVHYLFTKYRYELNYQSKFVISPSATFCSCVFFLNVLFVLVCLITLLCTP